MPEYLAVYYTVGTRNIDLKKTMREDRLRDYVLFSARDDEEANNKANGEEADKLRRRHDSQYLTTAQPSLELLVEVSRILKGN